MARKYQFPSTLSLSVEQSKYERWLQWRAVAHVKRDRLRGNRSATVAEYKAAIHSAVVRSNGSDPYTGEKLDWSLIGSYRNELATQGGRDYKARFALLPSVDHVSDGLGPADFQICSWRANDAKSDLSYAEFVTLCRKVVERANEGPG
jgi:hypothetical protein